MFHSELYWTAPEHLKRAIKRKRSGSPQGDIYSFGIIAKEIVTREDPYAYLENELRPIGKLISFMWVYANHNIILRCYCYVEN